MSKDRRTFLKTSALLSASVLIPDFLKAFGSFSDPMDYRGKRLVVVQLSGGNDGLNCVVPYRNDLYFEARPGIALKEKNRIALTDEVALNANLLELADLYNAGYLSIINNVGYPNPNRSHFRSTDIWQSASHEHEFLSTGWVGRFLDSNCEKHAVKPHQAIELDDTLSLVLKGEKVKGLAFHDPKILELAAKNKMLEQIVSGQFHHDDAHVANFLHKSLRDTLQSADYVYGQSKRYKSQQSYPDTDFSQRMKNMAELICSGCETQIYYISLPGFDTHVGQLGAHGRVLRTFSKTMKSFCDDLKQNNQLNNTVILAFSEFGRRVKQNASKGTDHGTANNVYVIHGMLKKPGIYNEMPNLKDLDAGDLKFTVDFRQVYATLIENVLHGDSSSILGEKFETIKFL